MGAFGFNAKGLMIGGAIATDCGNVRATCQSACVAGD
jgi:hypothetical protein